MMPNKQSEATSEAKRVLLPGRTTIGILGAVSSDVC